MKFKTYCFQWTLRKGIKGKNKIRLLMTWESLSLEGSNHIYFFLPLYMFESFIINVLKSTFPMNKYPWITKWLTQNLFSVLPTCALDAVSVISISELRKLKHEGLVEDTESHRARAKVYIHHFQPWFLLWVFWRLHCSVDCVSRFAWSENRGCPWGQLAPGSWALKNFQFF